MLKQALLRGSGNVLLPAFLPQSLGGPAPSPAAPLRQGAWGRGVPRPPAAGPRRPRPLRRRAPQPRPAPVASRPRAHRREPAPGRPATGNRPADPAPETPRSGAIRAALRGSRKRARLESPATRARRQPHVPAATAPWVNVPINRANNLPRHIDFPVVRRYSVNARECLRRSHEMAEAITSGFAISQPPRKTTSHLRHGLLLYASPARESSPRWPSQPTGPCPMTRCHA